MNDPAEQQVHWLMRPKTIRLIWTVFIIILAFTVIAQLVIPVKGYFGVDNWFGFAALLGFFSCVAMVLVAKLLGMILKRGDTYYHD